MHAVVVHVPSPIGPKKTPEELRAEQVARAKADSDAREAAAKRGQEMRTKAMAAVAEALKNSWYGSVEKASKVSTDYRFVVLAEVISRPAPFTDEVQSSISADGYKVDFIKEVPNSVEGMVSDGQVMGWRPKELPKLGVEGSPEWMIVRW